MKKLNRLIYRALIKILNTILIILCAQSANAMDTVSNALDDSEVLKTQYAENKNDGNNQNQNNLRTCCEKVEEALNDTLSNEKSLERFCMKGYTIDDYIKSTGLSEISTWDQYLDVYLRALSFIPGGSYVRSTIKTAKNARIKEVIEQTCREIVKRSSDIKTVTTVAIKPLFMNDIATLQRELCGNVNNCKEGYFLCGKECCEQCVEDLDGNKECAQCSHYKGSGNDIADKNILYPVSFYFNGLKHTYCVYECKDSNSSIPIRCKINQKCKIDSESGDSYCVDKCQPPYKNSYNVLNTDCECIGQEINGVCCNTTQVACPYKVTMFTGSSGYEKSKAMCCNVDEMCIPGENFINSESAPCVKKQKCPDGKEWGINNNGFSDCVCKKGMISCGEFNVVENKGNDFSENIICCNENQVCTFDKLNNKYICVNKKNIYCQ